MTKPGMAATSGRPPKEIQDKVGRPVRALVTLPVFKLINPKLVGSLCKELDISLSDLLRLALYNLLRKYDRITPELEEDETWTTLRQKGLI